MNAETDYSQLSPDKLIQRVVLLETLKLAYLGRQYNGLEYHANNTTPNPTIEEELWKALYKAKLISPPGNPSLKEGELNWEGCEYSKCGRTDKGVSAFGQVISIRVRSNRPLSPSGSVETPEEDNLSYDEGDQESDVEISSSNKTHFDPIKDEIAYPHILNRLLPPEIRILAWCPSLPADFSARFSCTKRCYKYYFTQPAFAPSVGTVGSSPTEQAPSHRREGWLDIHAMREAARKFKGSHDFRNFCKVDPGKQIDMFTRAVTNADIVEVNPGEDGPAGYLNLPGFQEYHPPQMQSAAHDNKIKDTDESSHTSIFSTPKIYAFKVEGSGFLWHQVRHMVAVLFLIGQGLEKPSLIDDLLDIKEIRQKPVYDMADAAPLVLEDCDFGPGLEWLYLDAYPGNDRGTIRTGGKGDAKYGIGGAVDELWKVWHRHKTDEILAGSLLNLTARGPKSGAGGNAQTPSEADTEEMQGKQSKGVSQKVFLGGDSPRHVGRYIPILQRLRLESVDEINAKYLKRKGLDPPIRNKEKPVRPREE
ncbi:MAG: hypothetical protein Q9219_001658 [cf. Caloplaca sp. 3 TL-2023]